MNKQYSSQRLFSRFHSLVLLTGLSFLLVGCPSIPKQDFNLYLQNFQTVKATSQDVLLDAKILAKTVKEHPHNPKSAEAREKEFTEREKNLNARFEALNVIGQYNDVLTKLASGTDPKVVKSSLENLSGQLKALDIEKLTNLAGKAHPALGLAADTIAFIDSLIQKRKFKEAVTRAQPIVTELITIFEDDADDFYEINIQRLGWKSDPDYTELTKLRARFVTLLKDYKYGERLKKQVGKYNKLIDTAPLTENLKSNLKIGDDFRSDSVVSADTTALELMKNLRGEMNEKIVSMNDFENQITSHRLLMNEYKKALKATRTSFVQLNNAVLTQSPISVMDVAVDVMKLRQSYLEYQKAR